MAATDLPQPGDGAYLARTPQPGDGAYLMSSSGGPNGASPGPRRPGDRRRNNGNRNGKRNGGGASTPTTSTLTADASSISGPLENLSINGNSSAGPSQQPGNRQGRNRRNGDASRRRDPSKSNGDGTASGSRTPKFQPNPSAPAFEPGQAIDFSKAAPASTTNAGPSRRNRSRKPNKDSAIPKDQKDQKTKESKRSESPAPKVSSRRAAFEKGTKLTTNEKKESRPRKQHNVQQQPSLPEADDLNSRLTRGLAKKPYIECPIVSSFSNLKLTRSVSMLFTRTSRRGRVFPRPVPQCTPSPWTKTSDLHLPPPGTPRATLLSTSRVFATGLRDLSTTTLSAFA